MSQVTRKQLAGGSTSTGMVYHPNYFGVEQQLALICALAAIVRAAPPFQPTMPRTGKPFSVRMTNCGELGWVSDRSGYRYQPRHPVTGMPWPPLPAVLLELWRSVALVAALPEACLVNIYAAGAKMGSHQDRDEADISAPVVSLSLGCDAQFHVGGTARRDPRTRFVLHSGDVVVLGGAARLAFHGVDRIMPETSTLCLKRIDPDCVRLNLTLRRVTPGGG